MGHLRPSCTIAADGSLSPDSFRARRMPVTEEMGPGCVKTRTLFFKVEFWPRLGGNSSQEIFRHYREGTTREKDSQQVSRRSVFTQPGPKAAVTGIRPRRQLSEDELPSAPMWRHG